ncbi:MAG: ATP-binding protein [bacterium]|nr:ATP-binding protein [bacterium]
MAESVLLKKLELPSCADSLQEALEVMEEIANQIGLSSDGSEELAIALTEALNNAIFHGNGGVHEVPVMVYFEQVGDHLQVQVEDRGSGFDPDLVPDPRTEENIYKTSGRGILMMQIMVDEVRFNFSQQGTEVILMKSIKI